MKKILLTMAMIFTLFSCGSSSNKDEKVLYYNGTTEGDSFDPQLITDGFSMGIHNFLTEGLTDTLPDGSVIPRQAKSWEVSKDGLTWTFHLRDDLKWSDGTPVTAKDYEYAWKRALNPQVASEYAFILFPIKNAEKYSNGKVSADEVGIKVLDDKTLQVKLENVTPYFDTLVAFITYTPAKQSFVEAQGNQYALDKDKILYNGPFILKEWLPSDKMVLVKNPNYYDAKNIKFDKVLVKYIKDESAALNAYDNEELDFAQLSSEDAKRLKDDPKVATVNVARTTYLSFNTENKILKNENIRKALALGLDKELLVKSVFNNLKEALYTFTPKKSGIKGINADFSTEIGDSFPKFNSKLAKEYLAKGLKELGLKKLPELTLLIDDRYTFNKTLGETIQENLRVNLGINIKVDTVTFKERLARDSAGKFELLLNSWGADYQDPMTFLDLVASYNANNSPRFKDSYYDSLINKATKSVDKKDRMKYLKEAEYYLGKKMPIMPLYQEKLYFIINPKLKNVETSSFAPLIRLTRADKEK